MKSNKVFWGGRFHGEILQFSWFMRPGFVEVEEISPKDVLMNQME